MNDGRPGAELRDVIRRVRAQWRTKFAVRGAVIVIAGSLLALFLSARGLEAFKFSSPAVIAFRVATFAVFVSLALYWVRPLLRRVTDAQVALYLEEHDPTLQAAILSAVETSADGSDNATSTHSAALAARLVEQAVERCRDMDFSRGFERSVIQRHLAALVTIVAAATLLLVFGPAYLRHGISALLVVSRSAEAASPYHIDVRPGNATVPRGSDQAVSATIGGFKAGDATMMVRASGSGSFDRVPLVATGDPARFEGMLFHVDRPVEYFVESSGVRSPVFTMQLVDLPAVKELDLEYRFPAYTGLAPQRVATAGDVAALRGTEVMVHVVPTMKTPGGRIVLNENAGSPLAVQPDGSLTGRFTIDRQGFYRIELVGPKGEPISASPQYTIDVVSDQAPSVSLSKPGRDTSATPVEELFVEAKAEDDFGVKDLELHYSVNGGQEKTAKLFDSRGKPKMEVSAGHTVYFEELGVQPGDFVSYYARATDNDQVAGPKAATSDIYFVQVRPFRKDYRAAQSQAQGGGGGQSDVGALSQQQRQIVAATFNAVRDREKLPAGKFRENVVFLTLAQSKLRQQVDELVQKMSSRLIDRDPAFQKIAETLPKASREMTLAEGDLRAQKAKDALTPEQRALKLLQDAEQEYEVQVSASRGGGGGGQNDEMANDLADLFELEMDKLANQYEMQQRADQQGADRKIDELAEKLKELARRQQQEAERQRRLSAAGANGAGGGASQRALAEQVEEAARRLEQLTREQPRPDLADAARRLQSAADAMRRAAANGVKDGGSQAAKAGEELKRAEQQLSRSRSQGTERDVQNAQRQAADLAEKEKQVASGVNALGQLNGAGREAQARKLGEQKDQIEAGLGSLQQQLQKLADDTRAGSRDASRKLESAADSIRDNKVREKVRYSKGMLQSGNPEYARAFEENIGSNLDELQKKIGEAAGALGQTSKETAANRALEQARDLLRGMQSLGERMNQRGQDSRKSSTDGKAQGSADASTQASADAQRRQAGQRAQANQPGQSGARGEAQAGDPRTQGGGRLGGPPPDGGGAPGAGRFSDEERRQFSRELREQFASGEALRRQLSQAGMKPADMDEILRRMQALTSDRLFDDPRGLQQLQAAALDQMKKFEFNLRKKADTGGQPLSLSGSDEVPPGFRQAIEEYYRALAKKPSSK